MKAPVSWLKEFVAFEDSPESLAERLTFAGLEVEGIERVGSEFRNIVAAEVVGVRRHPNADRLLLCEVETGRGRFPVVCGAPNVKAGDKAPFAEPGAVLPGGTVIRAAKIRGEPSAGMLCAEDDLGLSDDHAGLMALPAGTAPGTPLAGIVGGPDAVLTIEVTPNRPDCLSLLGIAREVAALYGLPLNRPAAAFPETGAPIGDAVSVTIEDPAACPRYTARLLRAVTLAPSPLALRLRLARCGIRPINNVVDITNYVMLECGQPLHAFDLAQLAGSRLTVRRARPGERLATLDEVPRELAPSMLVIADAAGPVAVAGVMGGARSGILPATRDVVLESACFLPRLIRKTSKSLELATESSYRFERGVDAQATDWASRRAAALMVRHAGAAAAPGALDVFPAPPPARRIVCRFNRVRGLLGIPLEDDAIVHVFQALDLPVAQRAAGRCAVEAPSFRPDLEAEVDLIEEVARLHGLDKIPAAAPQSRIVPGVNDGFVRAAGAGREALVGLGLTEIMNYSLLSDKLLAPCSDGRTGHRVALPRPISADQSILRDSLLPQMIETLGRNRARQVETASLFEIGRVFYRDAQGALAEDQRLAIGLMGPAGRVGFESRAAVEPEDAFLWLKGILEALCQRLFIRAGDRPAEAGAPAGLGFMDLKPETPQDGLYGLGCLEKGRGAFITLDGAICGAMGLIHAALRREWRWSSPVAVLELRLEPLLARAAAVPAAAAPPVYPAVTRDLALRAPAGLRHQAVAGALWEQAPPELASAELFDIFTRADLGAGFKSMAYSLTYRSPDRTLTDEEVNRLHEALKARLQKHLGVEIRDRGST